MRKWSKTLTKTPTSKPRRRKSRSRSLTRKRRTSSSKVGRRRIVVRRPLEAERGEKLGKRLIFS